MSRLGWAGLYLAVVSMGAHLGPGTTAAQKLGVATGLVAWAAAMIGARAHLATGLGIVAGAGIILASPGGEIGLALLAGLMVCVASRAGAAAAGFVGAVLAWSLLRAGVSWLWFLEVEFSRAMSWLAGHITGHRLDLGPSASGLDLLVIWLIATLAAAGRRRPWPWRRGLAGTGAWITYTACLPWLAALLGWLTHAPTGLLNFANSHPEPGYGGAASLIFATLPALCAVFMLLSPESSRLGPNENDVPPRRFPAVVTFGAAGILACLLWMTTVPGARRPGDVAILRTPTIAFSLPSENRPGLRNAGMFGMLEHYLGMAGHRLRVIDGPLRAGRLDEVSVLAVILPVKPPDARDRALIKSFLDEGGSLLIMGDHTDLLGTRSPLNEWTRKWGIRFRFDSAYPVRRQWDGCLDRPGVGSGNPTGIGTGASLEISGRAKPMIVGRYALSDRGDRDNGGAGAFLGNYSYDEGERVGDLVLAASTATGRGRVVVFGDTSSFQNLMLPISYPFVAALFDELASTPSWPREPALALAGILAAVLGWRGLRGDPRAAAVLAVAILLPAAMVPAAGDPARLDGLPRTAPVAHVDASHLNGYSLEFWRRDSIGGLLVNLQRNGFLPVFRTRRFENPLPGPAHLPVLVAPRAPLNRKEAEILRSHVEGGGDILVAAGAPHRRAVAPLLNPFGLKIGSMPLGPVPVEADMTRAQLEQAMQHPQFRDAWPVISRSGGSVRSLYDTSGYTLVAEARSGPEGEGRLLVVGDPDFLTDGVLEDEQGAWPGNVRLLARMLAGDGS